MEVQKHLFVIERGVIKELLKLKNERLFYMRLAPGTLPWRTLTFMEIICRSLVIRLRLQCIICKMSCM